MSIVQRLTEGIVNRDLSAEGAALINKWEQTGLLEGISDDAQRNGMARLLENQAKELLRESSSMAGGDVEGFAAVAFPLVRRVFGSLIANDLVSVQPMSLPSGLIFFLDFTFGGTVNDTNDRLGFSVGDSVYGGGRVGSQITGGVLLEGEEGTAGAGAYNLRNGYSSPTGSGLAPTIIASGTLGAGGTAVDVASVPAGTSNLTTADVNTVLRFDPDLTSGSFYVIAQVTLPPNFNKEDLVAMANIQGGAYASSATTLVPRLIQLSLIHI